MSLNIFVSWWHIQKKKNEKKQKNGNVCKGFAWTPA